MIKRIRIETAVLQIVVYAWANCLCVSNVLGQEMKQVILIETMPVSTVLEHSKWFQLQLQALQCWGRSTIAIMSAQIIMNSFSVICPSHLTLTKLPCSMVGLSND